MMTHSFILENAVMGFAHNFSWNVAASSATVLSSFTSVVSRASSSSQDSPVVKFSGPRLCLAENFKSWSASMSSGLIRLRRGDTVSFAEEKTLSHGMADGNNIHRPTKYGRVTKSIFLFPKYFRMETTKLQNWLQHTCQKFSILEPSSPSSRYNVTSRSREVGAVCACHDRPSPRILAAVGFVIFAVSWLSALSVDVCVLPIGTELRIK